MNDDHTRRPSRPNLPAVPRTIGDVLVREKLISLATLDSAVAQSARTGVPLDVVLINGGLVTADKIADLLSQQFSVPRIDLRDTPISAEVARLVSQELCIRHSMVPVALQGTTLVIAIVNPGNISALDDLRFKTEKKIELVVATEREITNAREQAYRSLELKERESEIEKQLRDMRDDVEITGEPDEIIDPKTLVASSGEPTVVALVNLILQDALKRKASDIHIEPFQKYVRVRYRIDGILYEIMRPPIRLRDAIVSRIKIICRMDIAERRLPQDGRFKMKLAGSKTECDFRVSVLPFQYGEKVVMRLLDKANLQTDMTQLGFDPAELRKFSEAIHQPFGMVLVTGPTGSGKTTTLYSALAELNTPEDNISTAEDPIEYDLDGVSQCQMNDAIGMNFAAALRSFLRQDPDIIMVGEIRDFETAEIAVKAALTGHMVLSTLHTNDAPSTINRLLNMGIEPFMVTASLNLIAAQRLVRRVCAECAEPFSYEESVCLEAGLQEEEFRMAAFKKGKGCPACSESGYRGRIALYEILPMTDTLRDAVLQGSSVQELKRLAVSEGMQTLRRSALRKFAAGQTTLEEVLRVTRSD